MTNQINSNKKISVITAVFNGAECIQGLIDSLHQQTDKDFEWVVTDGASTDGTLDLLRSINSLNIKIISQEDFGIYDALNRGVKNCSGDYYLVLGADDMLHSNAIADYRLAIEDGADMVTANVKVGDRILKPNKGPSWRFGQFQWVSAHAVGLLIKKSLHLQHGYYSSQFPIAADQLFIKRCCQSGCNVKIIDVIVGEFGQFGVSSIDSIGMCTEWFRIQLLTEDKKWLIFFLYIHRMIKRLRNSNI